MCFVATQHHTHISLCDCSLTYQFCIRFPSDTIVDSSKPHTAAPYSSLHMAQPKLDLEVLNWPNKAVVCSTMVNYHLLAQLVL